MDTLKATRRLRTLGLFAGQVVSGKKIRNARMRLIYEKLKVYGFRETTWQYIYQGQLGGLVLPYDSGRCEVHVRFYEDRIFAEYEIGRSYISHFIGPRYSANEFLVDFIGGVCSGDELIYLRRMLSPKHQSHDERSMKMWHHSTGEDLFQITRSKERVLSAGLLGVLLNLTWKYPLFLLLLMLNMCVLFSSFSPGSGIVSILLGVGLWRHVPTRGDP